MRVRTRITNVGKAHIRNLQRNVVIASSELQRCDKKHKSKAPKVLSLSESCTVLHEWFGFGFGFGLGCGCGCDCGSYSQSRIRDS